MQQLSGRALEAEGPGHEPRRRDELHFDAVLGADAAQEDVFQRAWQAAAGTRVWWNCKSPHRWVCSGVQLQTAARAHTRKRCR